MAHRLEDAHAAAAKSASEPTGAALGSWALVVAGTLAMFFPLLILGADLILEVPPWLTSVALVLVLPGAAAYTHFTHACAKARGLSTRRVMWRTLTAPFGFLFNLP